MYAIRSYYVFKDVVGEIRDPSDDSGKVLDTSRSLLCVAIILQVVLDRITSYNVCYTKLLRVCFIGANIGQALRPIDAVRPKKAFLNVEFA